MCFSILQTLQEKIDIDNYEYKKIPKPKEDNWKRAATFGWSFACSSLSTLWKYVGSRFVQLLSGLQKMKKLVIFKSLNEFY